MTLVIAATDKKDTGMWVIPMRDEFASVPSLDFLEHHESPKNFR
jgi:hypothetical protein